MIYAILVVFFVTITFFFIRVLPRRRRNKDLAYRLRGGVRPKYRAGVHWARRLLRVSVVVLTTSLGLCLSTAIWPALTPWFKLYEMYIGISFLFSAIIGIVAMFIEHYSKGYGPLLTDEEYDDLLYFYLLPRNQGSRD